jgi:putative Mn2+ efflux pump MntP
MMATEQSETAEKRGRGGIRPDAASITAGLVFIGIGLVYLMAGSSSLQDAARWTGSVLVLGLGLAWVVGAITRRRR